MISSIIVNTCISLNELVSAHLFAQLNGFKYPYLRAIDPQPLQLLDKIGLGTCLSQEQFEEYDRDSQIGASSWHDQPIDWIGPLRPPI